MGAIHTVMLDSGVIGKINSDFFNGKSPNRFIGSLVNVKIEDEEVSGTLSKVLETRFNLFPAGSWHENT